MAERDEYERARELVNQINSLRAENAQLLEELDSAKRNVVVLISNIGVLEGNMHYKMSELSSYVGTASEDVSIFFKALQSLTEQYFVFKNLSSASKNLTQYTDEYYTKFYFYNKLRRIALGYVIGVDNVIISDEALRLEVEKAYLKNTDYWLAYAIMAVSLWVKNDKEASDRALNKALSMDYFKSCVFFLLINLRFERNDVAREWYLNYLDKLDVSRLGDEFQYLLQAYLNGLFGTQPEFEEIVSGHFKRLLEQTESSNDNFAKKFIEDSTRYAKTYLHKTEEKFPVLQEISPDYQLMFDLLSSAEKNSLIAKDYLSLLEENDGLEDEQAQRIENVLYNLINSYDDDEWRVIKKQKYNESIIEAKGNLREARERFELLYSYIEKKKTLKDLMITWAFSELPSQTNVTVKKFTISVMKEKIFKGYENFAEDYRKLEPICCRLNVDGCELTCNEKDYNQANIELDKYFGKHRLKQVFSDKYVLVYTGICILSVFVLMILAISYSSIALTIAVISGVIGSFLLWRRIVDVGKMLEERKRLAHLKLKKALSELKRWRILYYKADEHLKTIKQVLERF